MYYLIVIIVKNKTRNIIRHWKKNNGLIAKNEIVVRDQQRENGTYGIRIFVFTQKFWYFVLIKELFLGFLRGSSFNVLVDKNEGLYYLILTMIVKCLLFSLFVERIPVSRVICRLNIIFTYGKKKVVLYDMDQKNGPITVEGVPFMGVLQDFVQN